MKKFVYSFFILTAGVMLLASCGTQLSTMSITKRHYNNGYYVEMNNNKHKSESVSREIKPIAVPVTQVTTAATDKSPEITPAPETTAEGDINNTSPKKRDVSKELTASAVNHIAPSNLKHTITPNSLKELKNIQAVSKRIVSEDRGHNNGNSSLIWTIIVILLLLWLISLLTGGWGLGGLIYLLLVIAIVLIILKLLGII